MGGASLAKERIACSVQGLSKQLGTASILHDFSLELAAEESVLLMGRNGAGKSTLLRMLAGVLQADAGSVKWSGAERAYLSQDLLLYGSLTVAENLRFFSQITPKGFEPDLERWQLLPHRHVPLNTLSKGQQQRVALCRVFAQQSSYLLLDEPTTHLDAQGIEILASCIKEQPGRGMLVVSHDIANVGPLVERAVVLAEGQIAADSREQSSLAEAISFYREANR